ncbi:MotA/TolQ/ExbB proton channel family protein [Flavobacteriales bacterium]|nr:MotA/TolQ/ExbB proton channel family protein [Flavobacteriales bacterium]
MRKLFALFAMISLLAAGTTSTTFAQDSAEEISQTDESATQDKAEITQTLKEKFIEGGPFFMSFVLIALILGLALCIERIIFLNLSTQNTHKLLSDIESSLASGGIDEAKELCRNTKGPVAGIFYQGLDRASDGENLDAVEKSVIAYGGIQAGILEKGLPWIQLFIALAPMLGFLGTVIGMIDAFDSIQAAGKVDAVTVAGGIKTALITTVSGLVVAIILQVFYNYIVSKIDSLINGMEDASISFIDLLIKHNVSKG